MTRQRGRLWVQRVAQSMLACGLVAGGFLGCGAGSSSMDMNGDGPPAKPPEPMQLTAGTDLHLIVAWTPDVLLVGQGATRPLDKHKWDALYRLPAAGGDLERLAQDVYGVRFLRQGTGRPAVVSYSVPMDSRPQDLHSIGRLFLCWPGQAPREVQAKDGRLVWQPAVFSPDGAYLLSYGINPDLIKQNRFSIDVTEVATGTSRQLGTALAVAVPRWFGFGGTGPRYVELPGISDIPFAAFRLDQEPSPIILPGRMSGILPDGRAVTEGDSLQGQELRPGATPTQLADGPIVDYSSFVYDGLAYFIRAQAGMLGTLVRLGKDGKEQTVLPRAASLWGLAVDVPLAYLSDADPAAGANDMLALDLVGLGTTRISAEPVTERRPLPGGGVIVYKALSQHPYVWLPGQKAATSIDDNAGQVIQVRGGRFAVLEQPLIDKTVVAGTLRVAIIGGQTGPALTTGVEFIDTLEGEPDGANLVYSVIASGAGRAQGIWRQPVP